MSIRRVAAEDDQDLGVFILGLAENRDGSGRAFLLQRAHAFDDQDRTLGQDTYAITTHTEATTYGGIERAALSRSSLELELSATAQQELGLPRSLTLRLEVQPDEVALLTRSLDTLGIAFEVKRDT